MSDKSFGKRTPTLSSTLTPEEVSKRRKRSAMLALALGVVGVPLFARATDPTLLWLGTVIVGVGGIGIWGMAPTYLGERFATAVRGVGPGFAYHAGAAIGSLTPTVIGLLQRG